MTADAHTDLNRSEQARRQREARRHSDRIRDPSPRRQSYAAPGNVHERADRRVWRFSFAGVSSRDSALLRELQKKWQLVLGSAVLANLIGVGLIVLAIDEGRTVKHIDRQVSHLPQAGASLGDAGAAIYRLAVKFDTGDGVHRNYLTAGRLYRAASDAGCREGAFAVGRMYSLGEGVRRNAYRARWWFHRGEREPRSCS